MSARMRWVPRGCSPLDRPELRQAANPLLGRLISMGSSMSSVRCCRRWEFGREHLGWQEEGDEAVDIRSLDVTGQRGSQETSAVARWCTGVDVSRGRCRRPWWLLAAALMAWCTSKVMAHRPGVTWLRLQGFLEDMQGRTGAVVHHRWSAGDVGGGSFDQLATDVRSQVEFAAACGVMIRW